MLGRSRSFRVGPLRRDFPPAAEGLIHQNEGRGSHGFTVRELILGGQEGAFGVEDREKICHPELIPLPRQVLGLLTRLRRGPQRITARLLAGERDQGGFRVFEGEQDALFVLGERRLGARIGGP